ncbi:type II RES/Xre toxin-antitoxin system antitoxin [Roseivivax sp. CAU 1761]
MEAVIGASDVSSAIGLLGGESAIHARVRNSLDVHELLLKGLPADALLHLVSSLSFLERGDALQNAIGLSIRTLQRYKSGNARQLLSVEQSSRAWRFAELFAHATEVLGSEGAAEEWLTQPAIGLENRKPLEPLATSAGVEAVSEYLTRLEYGVYT